MTGGGGYSSAAFVVERSSYALNICAVKNPATCDNYLQMVLSLKG